MVIDLKNNSKNKIAPLALIATPGARELAKLIDGWLKQWLKKDLDDRDTFILDSDCPRFTNGEAKGIVFDTVRGKDLYVICDPYNHGITYNMYGKEIPMTPDEHYADLKRLLATTTGKPNGVTVIMPMLYGGRQHRRSARESLDCAVMLHELQAMGVKDVITFDAHDDRVQNAVPLMGFDNYYPHYQILKKLSKHFPDVQFNKDKMMIISPDEGAMNRNIAYATNLGLDLGMFYKRRDYTRIISGRNPIISHEYIGSSVMGMDVFVADDIIATGDSILKLSYEIKEKGAKRVFLSSTFALFTEGLAKFDKAYEEKAFDGLFSTNLTYRIPELSKAKWFYETDMSKYLSYIIAASNYQISATKLLSPIEKIKKLMEKINNKN